MESTEDMCKVCVVHKSLQELSKRLKDPYNMKQQDALYFQFISIINLYQFHHDPANSQST
jgi:hypothetical protein